MTVTTTTATTTANSSISSNYGTGSNDPLQPYIISIFHIIGVLKPVDFIY